MAAGRKVRPGGRGVLEPLEQSLGLLCTHVITKRGPVLFVFHRHQTISLMLRIMSTEPSPIRAEPEKADRLDRKPFRGFWMTPMVSRNPSTSRPNSALPA